MLKAIIVDDEKHCSDRLGMLLHKHLKSVQVIKICSTITEAKRAIENENPDVVFLDIQLNDNTGFDLLSQIKNINFEVIFTTGYDNYAIKAFKFSALDYLLKPIDKDDLKESINKLKKQEGLKNTIQKIETLFHNFKNNVGHSKRLAIPTLEGLIMVDATKIIHLQSDINYTHIFISSGKKITTPKTLKYFNEILDMPYFFRIHKSHMVNLSFVESYRKGKGGHVVLTNGSKLEVAVRRKEQLLQKLNSI